MAPAAAPHRLARVVRFHASSARAHSPCKPHFGRADDENARPDPQYQDANAKLGSEWFDYGE